ncbi:MAG TPA: DUF2207 domain-containing protein, partial [Caldilineaceae bacterium]|nr:DUF2207 domain-containing protein [Caldilineaceae bacterium]
MLSLRLLALLLLLSASLAAPAPSYGQGTPPITYRHFNTELVLEDNGLLHVRMVQQLQFDGQFSSAFYEIPRRFTSDITNVRVLAPIAEEENLDPATERLGLLPASIDDGGGSILVEWSYPRTSPGDIRLFVIEYDAVGALWLYPDQDFLAWQAVNAERSGLPVESSVVRLTLPAAIPMDQATYSATGPETASATVGQTIIFTATEPLPDGVAFEVEAAFPHGLLNAAVQEWQRAYDGESLAVAIGDFQADLTLRSDGTVHVRETMPLRVLESTLHEGFRRIDLRYMDDVTNIVVRHNGAPLRESQEPCTGCFAVNRAPRPAAWIYYDEALERTVIQEENAGRIGIEWTIEPTSAPASTLLEIEYDLIGALRVSPENQLLVWPVLPDYGDTPVDSTKARIELPPGVEAADVSIEGLPGQGEPQVQPDGSLLLAYDGPLPAGGWEIALTLPAGATGATKPAWQQDFERVMAEADAAAVAKARALLIRRFLGLLVLAATGLAAVVAWFRTGRQRVREQLGGYLSEPPSPLSPAIAGFLVERKASERAILGAIFHLATVGAIEIDLDGEITVRRRRAEPIGPTASLPDAAGVATPIARHLSYLFDRVILPNVPLDRPVRLSALGPALRANLPEIYAQLARDVQQYFIGVPGGQGTHIPAIAWIILGGVLLSLALFDLLSVFVALLIAVIGGSLLALAGRGRAAYTNEGYEEAEKWVRFKNYLLDLRRYGDQAAAQEILDRYFGYAVALGVEEVVLAQAESMGAHRPAWMPAPGQPISTSDDVWPPRDAQRPRPRPSVGELLGLPRPAASQPPSAPRPRPTLAGMSEQLGGSLRDASRNLGALLATAAGDAGSEARSVVFNSQLRQRE